MYPDIFKKGDFFPVFEKKDVTTRSLFELLSPVYRKILKRWKYDCMPYRASALCSMAVTYTPLTPLCNRPCEIYLHWVLGENIIGLAYFPLGFFLSCVSSIKTKRGGRPNIFTGMKPLKTIYIHCIVQARGMKRFTLFFMRDRLPVPADFFCQ